MKTNKLFIFILISVCPCILYGQPIIPKRATTSQVSLLQATASHIFIENIGQFDNYTNTNTGKILFSYEGLDMPVLFTPKGLVHLHRKVELISEKEEKQLKKQGLDEEQIERRRKIIDKVITMEWIGANPNVIIETDGMASNYFTYGQHQQKARGFTKLVYKNLYPQIDVVYYFDDDTKRGFSYKIVLRPGANINNVKMKYGGDIKKLKISENGTLYIYSDLNAITETAPVSFISASGNYVRENLKNDLPTSFKINANVVSFQLKADYDKNHTLIIDPFVSNTNTLTGSTAGKAKDIDFDYEGNVYVVGGEGGMLPTKLAKYNANGILQWTFNGSISNPSWIFGSTYGGWVVEKTTGNIYIGQGLAPFGSQIIRLNSNGVFDNYITPEDPNFLENWKMIWNCNNGIPQILVAGGGTTSNINLGICNPPSTNLSALNITGISTVAQDIADIIIDPVTNEMYTIYASGVGTPSITNRIYKNTAPYSASSVAWQTLSGFTVLSELNNRPYLSPNVFGNFENSLNALAVNSHYLFYWDGRNLKAFNKTDGSTAGSPLLLSGNTVLMQGGVIADECDNVFVGSINGTIKVYKFNGVSFDDVAAMDITIPGFINASVYDLAYDNGNKLLYASGNGFVASFDISAYCSSSTYTLSINQNCPSLSVQAGLTPVPPPGSVISYYLFSGAVQIATNNSGLFTGLIAGSSYTIKAFINEVCGGIQLSESFTLNINCPLAITTTHTDASCSANGTITATAFFGVPPYQFSKDGTTYQASGNFTGLSAGLYTIFVKDGVNTIASTQVSILNTGTLQLTTVVTPATCNLNNGVITGNATGGVAPLTYSIDGINFQTSNIFNSLSPNNYTVTVKDANGCLNATNAIVNAVLKAIVTATSVGATCHLNNGIINASATNGSIPYQYSIDGINFQASNIFNAVAPNIYTVFVKDVANCISSVPVTVSAIGPPLVTAISSATGCNNSSGSITASAANGSAPYLYSLDAVNFQSSSIFTGLATNNYTIYVKDANNCIATTNIAVNLNNNLTVDAGSNFTICEGSGNVISATSNASSFSWAPSNGLSSSNTLNPVASPTSTTTYTITASTGQCMLTSNVTIFVNKAPVPFPGKDTTICYGQNYNLFASGGLNYYWTPGTFLSNTNTYNPAVVKPNPGMIIYYLSVEDANGCKSLKAVPIKLTVSPPPKIFIGNDTAIALNQSLQLKSLDVNNSGFVNYLWSPAYGLNDRTIANPVAVLDRDITYTLRATNAGGCEGIDEINIKTFKGPEIYVPNTFTPNGDGLNDILKVLPIGLKALNHFTIFNRYGEVIFSTKSILKGWDGTWKGVSQPMGNFIWIAEAVTTAGKTIITKGSVLLIR